MYSHVPYAVASAIAEPHKAIGDGRASLVVEDQSVNTALDRALLDNTYDAARPRQLVGDGVNLDDLLNHRESGVVRMKQQSNLAPRDAVYDLVTPYIGGEILQVSQYRDMQQASRAGTTLDSQGLEADQLHQETATRFNGIERAKEAKIELVCRNIAEIGYRKLYEGVEWTLKRYQDEEAAFLVQNEVARANPSDWQFKSLIISEVGLGAGNSQNIVSDMAGIYSIQEGLKAQGSLMVDDSKMYNTLERMTNAMGLDATGQFFNNPDQPMKLIQAQNEKLMQMAQMMQQQLEALQQGNPLAEAEMVKQQGNIQIKREQNQTDLLKVQEQSRLKELEMMQEGSQFQADLTKDYTDMELKYNADVPDQGMEMSGRSTEELIAILSSYNAQQ